MVDAWLQRVLELELGDLEGTHLVVWRMDTMTVTTGEEGVVRIDAGRSYRVETRRKRALGRRPEPDDRGRGA